MRSSPRGPSWDRPGTWAQAAAALLVMVAVTNAAGAADDQVVEGDQGGGGAAPGVVDIGNVHLQGNIRIVGGGRIQQASPPDLAQTFDAQAFTQNGVRVVAFVNGRAVAAQTTAAHERASAAIRQRGEDRIAILEHVCRLTSTQVHRLQMALESDVKRVGSAIESMRDNYAAMTMPPPHDPRAREVMTALQGDAAVCRRLIEATPGPDSLLGTVIHDVLSSAQAGEFESWIAARRACRWRAMVSAVLVQLDESELGLTASQAQAIEQILLAETPRLEVLRDTTDRNLDGRMAHFGRMLVLRELGRAKSDWQQVLDPRQQAVLTARCGSVGDVANVDRLLVEQGVLVRTLDDGSRDKETN